MNATEAEQVCISAERALRHGSMSLHQFPGLLQRIISERLWEERQVPGLGTVKLGSLRELITGKPRSGWGEDPSKIEAVIRDDAKVLAMWREAMKGEAGRPKSDDIVTTIRTPGGNSRSATLARLQRDAPELFAQVKGRKLSANAAAIEAGFRVKTFTVPLDVERAAAALHRYFTASQLVKLRGLL